MLNPIQKRIAEGMNPLVAFLTEATCGEPCWHAVEDVCRCSCGGKNHGCLRGENGVQPVRSAKIDGYRYELAGVAVEGLYDAAKQINESAPKRSIGTYTYYWGETDPGAPARLKRATKEQVAKWPELKSFREAIEAIRDRGNYAWIEIERQWPSLLWKRV